VSFKRRILQLIKAGWISFDDFPNVKSNPLPHHASGSGGVNALEEEERGTNVLKLTMKRLYKMLKQIGYLKAPIKKQAIEHEGEYCEYHQHMGHHINSCEEFRAKVEDMMMLGMLRIGAPKENLVGTMTGFDKKVKICRYQPKEGGPPRMILARPVSTINGNYNTIPYN
jgi:hypothetical protein